MGYGGGHAYRRITTLLETSWMTQALRLPQFSFTPCIVTKAWRLLSPLAWGLRLETPRVVAATIKLVDGFAILAVPRKSTFHQGTLLCISAELQREEKGRGTVWVTIRQGLCYLRNWMFSVIFVSSQLHSSGKKGDIDCYAPSRLKKTLEEDKGGEKKNKKKNVFMDLTLLEKN